MGRRVKLLLDTHVVLWAFREAEKLPLKVAESISNSENELFVSAATAWEIASKQRIGKLPSAESLLVAYPEHLAHLGATELPITGRHALAAGQFDWEHRDPFDRVLAAQSMLESLPLVTADPAFHALPGVRTVWG